MDEEVQEIAVEPVLPEGEQNPTKESPQPERVKNYRALRGETQFLKNLTAGVIGRFGDSVDAIAYTWLVYAISGSASLSAITYGVNTLISVLFQPFTAALITQERIKRVLVLTDLGRAVLVCLTALLHLAGLARPWMLIAGTAFMSTLEAFRQPAGTALLPKLLSKEKYTVGMSLSGGLSRMAELVGLGLAGLIIAALGVSGALLIDAATFLASGLILSTLKLKLPPAEKEERGNPWRQFLQDTREGFQYVRKERVVLAICASACVLNFALIPINALQTAYVNEGLRLGPEALSVMGVAISIGLALGSLVFPKLAAKRSRFGLLFAGALGTTAAYLGLGAVSFVPVLWLKWGLLVLVKLSMGVAVSFANTSATVAFMEKTEEKYLARASGIMGSACMAAMPIGSFLMAGLAQFISVTALIFGFGVFSIFVALSFLLVKPLREI
jgi:DHA3 family macrolide efflux protein-like MFS transporter